MSANLYAVRFDDGQVKYGFSDGYTLNPQLFDSTAQAWAAYPGKDNYRGPGRDQDTGDGERVQLSTTGSALHARWATATRQRLTSALFEEDCEYTNEDMVHSFADRFGADRPEIENWARTD